MISFLKGDDFKKEYFDELDECSTFIRKEECNHYKVTMKRYSKNGDFKKYLISVICKGCNNEKKFEFNKSRDRLDYKCMECNICSLTFEYINTMDDNETKETKADHLKENNINIDEQKKGILGINNNIKESVDDKIKI